MNSVQRQQNVHAQIRFSQWRRGNALVLVSAMLVLLVLIATAFLARTQSQRDTAAAMQDASGDARRVDLIKKQLASEIAKHLFVKPIDPSGAANYIGGDSAGNRISPSMYSVRYGVEPASRTGFSPGDQMSGVVDPSRPNNYQAGGDGFPDGFNFAPYSVIPWTNWPDFTSPRQISSIASTFAIPNFTFVNNANDPNGNPLGNPGFGDTRWLRSTEPMRKSVNEIITPGEAGISDVPNGDRFSHWPHLSWLPTPANGYRLVKDIADIEATLLTGAMDQPTNDAFGTPYEQWLPNVVPAPITGAGADPLFDNTAWVDAFKTRRDAWFTRSGYQAAVLNASATNTLPNFIKLDDPMSIGRNLDPRAKGVSKSDEWVENTPRNIVARTFCDTDGDGFTDSFWFLAPVGKERNVRTIVGVSVIDNASMVDVNVATRADRRTTVGFTPSDLALVTSEPEKPGSPDDKVSSNGIGTDTVVGLFDNSYNQTFNSFDIVRDLDGYVSPYNFRVQFDSYRWAGNPTYFSNVRTGTGLHDVGQPSFLQALGLRSTTGTWNDYFYGQPVANAIITPPTNEPFSGNMIDLFGASGPVRPSQENPTYQTTPPPNPLPTTPRTTTFRAGIPNQPLVRPSERLRWFRSAATGQGTLFAESLTGLASNFEQSTLPNPSGDLTDPLLNRIGIPVPTRRFDASDELELRAYAGNNDPSSLSRLERSLNADDTMRDSQKILADTILRSTVLRGEAGGGQEQLTSPQLVKDLRRKITVVSGQRNEIMPPWLWIGRPYGITNYGNGGTNPNNAETFQNGMLWLDPHPDSPGVRDENGNGRIDSTGSTISETELGFGKKDLSRIACSSDPFLDGKGMDQNSTNPIDGRDFNRAVRYFEEMNAKLDLRKPLLVTSLDSNGIPQRADDGALDQYMALSVGDQQRAMQDFVREARGRLRMALRTHSPMGTGGSRQTNALADNYAQYTDRFYEHFLFTMNAQVQPKDGFFTKFSPNLLGTKVSAKSLGQKSGINFSAADPYLSFRSACSTEALTASMAANVATWRSRADLMYSPNYSLTGVLPDRTLPLRAIHQPILPTASAAYNQIANSPGVVGVASALRAADPSKETPPLITKATTGSVTAADIVFPGIEKHPFFTEVFFGWVYPATTAEKLNPISGNLELTPAVFDICTDTDALAQNAIGKFDKYKYVALVNGKVGAGYNSVPDTVDLTTGVPVPVSSANSDRDTLDKIRTPVIVVQVANPWNEPIRLGDFRINIFGTDYDFPDYELDSNGNVVMDAALMPVPLMLAPGTETEPATATVYLIANTLGNPSNATTVITPLGKEGDIFKVAMWDPLFRRRWLDYFDLYEYSDAPVATDSTWLTMPQLATSPPSSPLFPFTMKSGYPGAAFDRQLSRSKLLNAMQDTPSKPSNFYKVGTNGLRSLSTFKQSLTRDNMARGVSMHRVLKDPSTGVATGTLLEVDRFDGHSELDHWTTTGTNVVAGTPMFADDRNFDTNLVTGGRFWTAAARITLPPTAGVTGGAGIAGLTTKNIPDLLGAVPLGAVNPSDYSYDGPGASASLFPPPTTAQLVRSASKKFRYLPIAPLTTACGVTNTSPTVVLAPDSVYAPPLFPGIVLGKVLKTDTKADGDYFTTWTHVSRNWSRLFDAKFVAVRATQIPNPALSVSSQTNLPVWDYTRQLVTGSFASNPLPTDPTKSRSPMIPVERFAPRFVFSNRTEPEFTNRPPLLQPARVELSGFVMDAKLLLANAKGGDIICGSNVTSSMTPWTTTNPIAGTSTPGTVTVPVTGFTSAGDVFQLGSFSPTDDPDIWNPDPDFVSDTWLIPNKVPPNPPVTFNMLLTPVWAPLPDFCGLMPPAPSLTPQSDVVPVAQSPWPSQPKPSWPTLVLRKPTSFNCQTVMFHDGFNYYPKTVESPLPPKVIAFYGNSRDGATGPNLFSDTKFVTPLWSVPAGSVPVKNTDGKTFMPDGQYRVFMGDKGARLLDHDGLLLPIDLATGSEVVANPLATPPILARPWLARGLWNTLDRVPQAGSLQMLQKDDDFEQIGELLDVFAWGPAYRIDSNALQGAVKFDSVSKPYNGSTLLATVPNYQAKATFAEIMSNRVPGFPVGEGPFINRIQVDPLNVAFSGATSTPYQFGGTSALRTPYAPNVPWGMRIFDCFTVDGAGAALRFDWTIPDYSPEIDLGGSASTLSRNTMSTFAARPVGALVPVDVRSTINTSSTTTVSPQILAQWEYDRSPSLSGNFSGLPTKGLLNINTASIEALKTLPCMTMMVYEDTGRFDGPSTIAMQIPVPGSSGGNRFVRVPMAIEIYRNQLDPNPAGKLWAAQATDPMATAPGNLADYPTYKDRGGPTNAIANAPTSITTLPLTQVNFNTGMQSQRGISSIGEVLGIARQASEISWTIRTAGSDPYSKTPDMGWAARDDDPTDPALDPLDARISTDRQGVRQFDFVTGSTIKDRQVLTYDTSYGDSEELNLLFKGISNLVTTRSDVFTVYFKVRTVKQNPINGKWNGSDRESVIDDARYVMCVDRTNVNRPTDEPRIVYFSRVPD